MFYCHAILARKAPLGTVWIAAHLERKIKKLQIKDVDIGSSAEYIMFPDTPIALRMSAHLLLGLVRIYSFKVNYLFRDCNRMLTDIRTAFAATKVNLPEEAERAPFESVTLPETFELDALELDDSTYQMDGPDNHQKAYDQITLTDEIPVGDQYVAFLIDEGNRTESVTPLEASNSHDRPMEEDILPPFEGDLEALVTPHVGDVGSSKHDQSNQADGSIRMSDNSYFAEVPEIEVPREAEHESGNLPWDELSNDTDGAASTSVTKGKHSLSPIIEGVLASGEESLPSISRAKATDNEPAEDHHLSDTRMLLGNQPLPGLELQPSPVVKQKNAKKRKKKQSYDSSIVLNNAEMKKQLEDCSKLVRKRRKLPCSSLDVWRHLRRGQNEQILYKPLLSGICNDLQDVFERHLTFLIGPSRSAEAPGLAGGSSDSAIPEMDMEPEIPRFGSITEELRMDVMQSPAASGDRTPMDINNMSSVPGYGKTIETELMETPVSFPRNETLTLEPEVESSLPDTERFLYDSNMPEFPSMMSPDIEDFNFLEASNESSGYNENDIGSMSARTKAVAQYFKDHSPSSIDPENQSGTISLNKILEGKTRKQCSRMFYESLVLKSYGYIHVDQVEAYGDIVISPTPELANAKL